MLFMSIVIGIATTAALHAQTRDQSAESAGRAVAASRGFTAWLTNALWPGVVRSKRKQDLVHLVHRLVVEILID